MDINATIIGQFLTFAILIWFTMKYVWPPIIKAMHDREKKIAKGLEAAEQSKQELELAEHKATTIIREAKLHATQLIEQANQQSAKLIEEAQIFAKQEGQRLINLAQGEIDKEITQAREVLRGRVATLAVAGAEKLLQRNLDVSMQRELLDQLAAEI